MADGALVTRQLGCPRRPPGRRALLLLRPPTRALAGRGGHAVLQAGETGRDLSRRRPQVPQRLA